LKVDSDFIQDFGTNWRFYIENIVISANDEIQMMLLPILI